MTPQEKFREIVYETNGLSYPPQVRWAGSTRTVRKRWNSTEELDMYLGDFGGRLKTDKLERAGFLVIVLEDEHFDHGKCVIRPAVVAEVPVEFATKVLALGFLP